MHTSYFVILPMISSLSDERGSQRLPSSISQVATGPDAPDNASTLPGGGIPRCCLAPTHFTWTLV
ncbi:hypothetical protein CERSUDRAFT_81435 [Gelatoporia subvermispora B]|uniref:Uncharacterized protein n=1 Tax=Ceriporiopsis subvermispora (strain B) TaxID=914234 RepID=M2RMQ6_CERS8|nr:hypothetical protein CERSUDRAFT_81435 [Gelatoporia subvermispora B]